MSAPTTEKAKPSPAPKPKDEATADAYNGPDPHCKELLNRLIEKNTEYTTLAAELKAAQGNEAEAKSEFVKSSTDPEAVKLREQIKKLHEQLTALADKKVQSKKLSDEEVKTLETELNDRKAKIKKTRDGIVVAADVYDLDPEGVKKALDDIPDPTRKRGTSSTSGAGKGTGLPRASVNVTLKNDKMSESEKFGTLGEAATYLAKKWHLSFKDNPTAEFGEAYGKAAGVTSTIESGYLDLKTIDKTVTFDYNGFKVVVEPKERKTRGSKKNEE